MRDFGGPEVLELREMARPEPGPDEVLIEVSATIVNSTRDVLTRTGGHAFSRFVTPPHILGGEHAGRVAAVGEGVNPGLLGASVAVAAAIPCGRCEWCLAGADQVCAAPQLIGVHRAGAYAEFALAPTANVLPVPDGLSAAQAAALATTGPVGLAQVDAAEVGDGDVVIVPGVAGALGSMLAALCTRRGARVVGLARHPIQARQMPLDVAEIVDAGASDLSAALTEACGPAGAQAVIDNICVPHIWDACLSVLRPGGRVVISGATGSGPVSIDPRRLYLANHSILGVRTGGQRSVRAFWTEVERGFRLPDALVEVFPLAEAATVHGLVQAGGKHGHFVLSV